MKYKTIIIGGGASGMMAAAIAGSHSDSVLLIEKNTRLGHKLSISGGGRCNITNAEDDLRTLLEHYGEASKFLYSAFTTFGVRDTLDYFHAIGLPTKVEDRKRAFPQSDSAKDVVNVLRNQLIKHNVKVMTNATVQDILCTNGSIDYVLVDDTRLTADSYILSTGGTSKPETGSTGDGFTWLERMGHSIKQPTPNVTPLAASGACIKDAQGLKIQPAKVSFFCDGAKSFDVKGDVLITHFGISGPVILNSAHRVSGLLQKGVVTAKIDCLADLDELQLDAKLIELFETHPAKQLKNSLGYIVPSKISQAVLSQLGSDIDASKNNSEISRIDRLKVAALIKGLPLTIDKLMGFEKAVVADGGVDLRDINMRTMRSNIIDNLFVSGDLLNINRPSGGYSLQLCWTSGYVAGVESCR